MHVVSAVSLRSYPSIFPVFRAFPSVAGSQNSRVTMATEQERAELDRRAREGETVVPGGTGGKSLEAQEHLAKGRSRGGSKGGQTRNEQLGTEGYKELGRKGGHSTGDRGRYEDEDFDVDESTQRA